MKSLIKEWIKKIPLPLTRNHHYDLLTKKIIKSELKENSNCIDVGCHKGEIMDLFIKAAPQGKHFGFEPIPNLYKALQHKYASNPNCKVFNLALSDTKGNSTFNYVVSNPSYSGLVKRAYDKKNEKDKQINVKVDLLDEIIDKHIKIDMIKIDVEGGEYQVLKGARKTIQQNKPLVIFEHGLGASEYYGATPDQVYLLFEETGLSISLLEDFVKKKKPLDIAQFNKQFYDKLNYYFIAHPNI